MGFLSLLQFVSPALPVGAYSYSEGLEWLVDQEIIANGIALESWLNLELKQGSIRLETAILLRAYQSILEHNLEDLSYWNDYLSASRETLELRQQSWQMGQSLRKLLLDLFPEMAYLFTNLSPRCNYAIVWAIAASCWRVEPQLILLGYLQSWVSNLVSAGVRLVPLGQTTGQKILGNLQPQLITTSQELLSLQDEDLQSCSWGLSLASMNHESQYTRLFRS
ncbi:MAG: urease accessory protein UreF [Microcystaceae cyanobacterium]